MKLRLVIQTITLFYKYVTLPLLSCYSLSLCIKFASFAFQPNFPDVDMPEGDRDLMPIDTASSQAPDVASAPEIIDHTAEYIGRIMDLEDRVKVLKK
jgi:hypothetical protein